MKFRSLAAGLALLATGTLVGVTTQHIASAEVSSGDRPVLVPIEPCRLVDTRPNNTVGPRSSRVGAGDTLTVDAQEPDTACTGEVPADALSLALNVTAIGASEQTFLTIWAGGTRPTSSSLNPAPGAPPTPNAVTVDLSGDQEFEIYNNLGSLNLLVDVTGYYTNHNHDDRYFTKAEFDSAVATWSANQPWSIPITPTELVNPSAFSSTPQLTLTQSSQGFGFFSTDVNPAWASIVLPPNYTPGQDLRFDVHWIPQRIPGGPGACTALFSVGLAEVSRPGLRTLRTETVWEQGQTSYRPTELSFPIGNEISLVVQSTFFVATGTIPVGLDEYPLLPGDSITVQLQRHGDDPADTCSEALVLTGLMVQEAT